MRGSSSKATGSTWAPPMSKSPPKTAGLGAVGGYAALSNYTALGGTLTVFALPQ